MKAVKKISIIFLILGGFRPAMGAPLQQGPIARINYPAITGQPINSKPKDTIISFVRDTSFNHIDTKLKAAALRLKQKAVLAKEYLAANGFNSDICFMVDMSIPSGKNRFFVYNIKKDSVEFTSLVSHGSGSWKPNCDDQLVFSNLTNSNATSLGRYKIGTSYSGLYGLSYKLFGLDSTNNNAFQRSVVLHSDVYVPEKETYPYHIFESAGCPTVSPSFLPVLGKYVKGSKKPMMMWIYN